MIQKALDSMIEKTLSMIPVQKRVKKSKIINNNTPINGKIEYTATISQGKKITITKVDPNMFCHVTIEKGKITKSSLCG